jgi:hypothetical protein
MAVSTRRGGRRVVVASPPPPDLNGSPPEVTSNASPPETATIAPIPTKECRALFVAIVIPLYRQRHDLSSFHLHPTERNGRQRVIATGPVLPLLAGTHHPTARHAGVEGTKS